MSADCRVCETYTHYRGKRIRTEIAKTATSAREGHLHWLRFMDGVHERHLEQTRQSMRTAGRFAALMSLALDDTDKAKA